MDAQDPTVAAQIEAVVLGRIQADDLVLPALPSVVFKALTLLRTEDFSLGQVAAAIEPDPLVAARIVRLVNSAALASREPASSILQAVTRLGGGGLHAFLIEISARSLFESRDARIKAACRTLWEHSVAAALLARELAVKVGASDPDAAYLAGLLHDVGKPILAAMLLDAEKRLFGTRTQTWIAYETWMGLITGSHRRVGLALARRWDLPAAVQAGIANYDAYDPAEPRCVANLVRFANALTKQTGMYLGDVDTEDLETTVADGHELTGLTVDLVKRLTSDLSDRVQRRIA